MPECGEFEKACASLVRAFANLINRADPGGFMFLCFLCVSGTLGTAVYIVHLLTTK